MQLLSNVRVEWPLRGACGRLLLWLEGRYEHLLQQVPDWTKAKWMFARRDTAKAHKAYLEIVVGIHDNRSDKELIECWKRTMKDSGGGADGQGSKGGTKPVKLTRARRSSTSQAAILSMNQDEINKLVESQTSALDGGLTETTILKLDKKPGPQRSSSMTGAAPSLAKPTSLPKMEKSMSPIPTRKQSVLLDELEGKRGIVSSVRDLKEAATLSRKGSQERMTLSRKASQEKMSLSTPDNDSGMVRKGSRTSLLRENTGDADDGGLGTPKQKLTARGSSQNRNLMDLVALDTVEDDGESQFTDETDWSRTQKAKGMAIPRVLPGIPQAHKKVEGSLAETVNQLEGQGTGAGVEEREGMKRRQQGRIPISKSYEPVAQPQMNTRANSEPVKAVKSDGKPMKAPEIHTVDVTLKAIKGWTEDSVMSEDIDPFAFSKKLSSTFWNKLRPKALGENTGPRLTGPNKDTKAVPFSKFFEKFTEVTMKDCEPPEEKWPDPFNEHMKRRLCLLLCGPDDNGKPDTETSYVTEYAFKRFLMMAGPMECFFVHALPLIENNVLHLKITNDLLQKPEGEAEVLKPKMKTKNSFALAPCSNSPGLLKLYFFEKDESFQVLKVANRGEGGWTVIDDDKELGEYNCIDSLCTRFVRDRKAVIENFIVTGLVLSMPPSFELKSPSIVEKKSHTISLSFDYGGGKGVFSMVEQSFCRQSNLRSYKFHPDGEMAKSSFWGVETGGIPQLRLLSKPVRSIIRFTTALCRTLQGEKKWEQELCGARHAFSSYVALGQKEVSFKLTDGAELDLLLVVQVLFEESDDDGESRARDGRNDRLCYFRPIQLVERVYS